MTRHVLNYSPKARTPLWHRAAGLAAILVAFAVAASELYCSTHLWLRHNGPGYPVNSHGPLYTCVAWCGEGMGEVLLRIPL